MNPTVLFIVGIGFGFLSGLRSLTPLALISWLAIWGWMPVAGSPFWFVGTEPFAIVISVLAVLELLADKLPKTPARTQLMPLIVRIITGAICGSALFFSAGRPWLIGAILGAIGSLAGAFSGYQLRHSIVARCRIPDLLVALAEDFLTIGGALILVRIFFHARL